MSVFDPSSQFELTADRGVRRIKRVLATAVDQAAAAINETCQVNEQVGTEDLEAELGDDQAEVSLLLQALKTLVEQCNPALSLPELPSWSDSE